MTSEQKKLFLAAIRSGVDLQQAAACAGLTRQQVSMRLRREPSFARAIEEALDACAAAITREIAP